MLMHFFSWPHFDLGSILQSVASAVLGFIAAVIRQNTKTPK